MKRLIMLMFLCLFGGALAQRSATVAGTIAAPEALPETARVGVHVVDRDGVWGREVGTATPQEDAFRVELSGSSDALTPFRSDDVVLPGLQNNYSLSREVGFTRAQVNIYLDENGNGTFDRNTDVPYLGLAGTEAPTGFFVLLYVDGDTTLEAAGEVLELQEGWNVFSVSFPEEGAPVYAISNALDNARLDVFPGAP
jgi:hypothetical protein